MVRTSCFPDWELVNVAVALLPITVDCQLPLVRLYIFLGLRLTLQTTLHLHYLLPVLILHRERRMQMEMLLYDIE